MLKYLEKTNDENVTNQDIDTIHHLVKKVKRRKEVGISYMKSWEIDRMNREEGRQEGIMAVITLLKELGVSREDTLEKLREKFKLSQVQAEEYMDNYWNE